MPASYAHYCFGQAVYDRLSKDIKEIINENREIYDIGLNGPDILFYYKPLKKNRINSFGHEIHRQDGIEFFNKAKKHILEDKDGLPYILGFLCHFILDSNCHPYISKAMKESGVSHGEIEAELDGRLMRKHNLSPQSVSAGKHIIPTKENSKIIAKFYDGISESQILESLRSVRFYNKLLLCENNLKRNIMKGVLSKIKGAESFSHMIINVIPNPKCKNNIDKLLILYEKSIDEAVQIIEEYYRNLNSDKSIGERFNRNFE